MYVDIPSSDYMRAYMLNSRECSLTVVAETVVGATTGVVPAPKGYFKAMKSVCDKYGALFILDEVMSGMGRTYSGCFPPYSGSLTCTSQDWARFMPGRASETASPRTCRRSRRASAAGKHILAPTC